jgi:hypothetical protein
MSSSFTRPLHESAEACESCLLIGFFGSIELGNCTIFVLYSEGCNSLSFINIKCPLERICISYKMEIIVLYK